MMRILTTLPYALPYLWLALIALAPLLYGLNPAWAWQGAVYAAAALSIPTLFTSRALKLSRNTCAALTLGLLVLTYVLLQSILPAFAGPSAELWHTTQSLLALPVADTISLTPEVTAQETTKWLLFAFVFLAVLTYRQHAAFQRFFFPVFLAVAALVTLYGFVSPTHIWGLEKPMYTGATTGTFLNKNTYAAYAGAALLASLFFLLKRPLNTYNPLSFLLGTSVLLQTIGLLTSQSRAGVACTILAAILLLAISTRKYWLLALPILFSPTLLLLPLGTFLTDLVLRGYLYKSVLNGMSANPIWGYGLGSFTTLFPSLRVPDMPLIINSKVTQAHNTYLETALEIGLPATLALGVALSLLLIPIFKRMNAPHSTTPLTLSILALFALHSLVDFTLEIPAITLFTLALLAKSQPVRHTSNHTFVVRILTIGLLTAMAFLSATTPSIAPTKNAPIAQFKQHLTQNPNSPYTWAHLAYQNAKNNQLKTALAEIEQSQLTGPYETRLLFYRIDLTAPLFKNMTPVQKNLFIRDVQSAHRHAPERIFRRLNLPAVAYALTSSSKPK